MKVVCESCQAKYQVPDERVAGKKLKIRCKRCGANVIIRGDLMAAPAPSPGSTVTTAASRTSDGFEWHGSVDGQTAGPFATGELLGWLAQNPAGWDAYVWREGFPEWIEARMCDALVIAAGGMAQVQAAAGDEEGPTRMFQGALPAAPSQPPPARASVAPRARASAPPTLRTSVPPRARQSVAPQAARSSQIRPPASSPRVSAAQAMTGERNEDSVLFSTRNLQQVARSASQPPGRLAAVQPGYAGGDGSGLIDIRALASLARQAPSVPPPVPYASRGPLPVSQGDESRVSLVQPSGGFRRADSLAPVTTHRRGGGAALPLAVFGGFALVAASAFAAIMITRGPAQPARASAPVTQPVVVAAAAQPAAPPPAVVAEPAVVVEEPAEEEAPAAAAPEPAQQEPAPTVVASSKSASKRRPRGARGSAADKKATPEVEKPKDKVKEKADPVSLDDVMLAAKPAAKPEPEPAPAPMPEPEKETADVDELLLGARPAKEPEKDRTIDDLLDGAVDKKPGAAAARPAPSLPEAPTRDQTLSAMRGIEPAVRACADGVTGATAQVQIQVSGSTGRVASADVTGVEASVSSCIARVARGAKFPRFARDTFAVKFPYRFK